MVEKKTLMLMMDEKKLAIHYGILEIEEILELLEVKPELTTIILTGIYMTKKLTYGVVFIK